VKQCNNNCGLRYQTIYILFGCLALLVVTAAGLAPVSGGSVHHADKLMHVTIFMLLALWFTCLLPKRYWIIFGSMVVYGLLLEWLQGLTSYRHADGYDLVADAVGAAAGTMIGARRGHGMLVALEARLTPN